MHRIKWHSNIHMGGADMITLYNVMDIRDNRRYSVVMVNQRKARFFVPVEEDE